MGESNGGSISLLSLESNKDCESRKQQRVGSRFTDQINVRCARGESFSLFIFFRKYLGFVDALECLGSEPMKANRTVGRGRTIVFSGS